MLNWIAGKGEGSTTLANQSELRYRRQSLLEAKDLKKTVLTAVRPRHPYAVEPFFQKNKFGILLFHGLQLGRPFPLTTTDTCVSTAHAYACIVTQCQSLQATS